MGELNSRIEGLKAQLSVVQSEVFFSNALNSNRDFMIQHWISTCNWRDVRLSYPKQNWKKLQKRALFRRIPWKRSKYGFRMIERYLVPNLFMWISTWNFSIGLFRPISQDGGTGKCITGWEEAPWIMSASFDQDKVVREAGNSHLVIWYSTKSSAVTIRHCRWRENLRFQTGAKAPKASRGWKKCNEGCTCRRKKQITGSNEMS